MEVQRNISDKIRSPLFMPIWEVFALQQHTSTWHCPIQIKRLEINIQKCKHLNRNKIALAKSIPYVMFKIMKYSCNLALLTINILLKLNRSFTLLSLIGI